MKKLLYNFFKATDTDRIPAEIKEKINDISVYLLNFFIGVILLFKVVFSQHPFFWGLGLWLTVYCSLSLFFYFFGLLKNPCRY